MKKLTKAVLTNRTNTIVKSSGDAESIAEQVHAAITDVIGHVAKTGDWQVLNAIIVPIHNDALGLALSSYLRARVFSGLTKDKETGELRQRKGEAVALRPTYDPALRYDKRAERKGEAAKVGATLSEVQRLAKHLAVSFKVGDHQLSEPGEERIAKAYAEFMVVVQRTIAAEIKTDKAA